MVRGSGAPADGHLLRMHASHACAAKLNREHPLIRLAQVIVRLVASPSRRQLPRTRPRDAQTHLSSSGARTKSDQLGSDRVLAVQQTDHGGLRGRALSTRGWDRQAEEGLRHPFARPSQPLRRPLILRPSARSVPRRRQRAASRCSSRAAAVGCGGGDRFVDMPDGLGRFGSRRGGGAWRCEPAASKGRCMVEKVYFFAFTRVARGVLWRGVRVAAGVSGGAAAAMGGVAKRAPAEACWGGRLALPLAFAARASDSSPRRSAVPYVSKNQLYYCEVLKIMFFACIPRRGHHT